MLAVSGALALGFAAGAQTGHDAPFDGHWWREAGRSEKLAYVFGWDMGVTQGELTGCQNALSPNQEAIHECVSTGFMNKIVVGPSMGEMVAMTDRYYDDPKHAADPPSTALTNQLWDLYKKTH
ncbi:MAG TPA: hypothetical protein VMJ93_02280 [Verrucomicrobiae bacterium]|nr:hypothetical protein [Verrucomicrobiae bacterium]